MAKRLDLRARKAEPDPLSTRTDGDGFLSGLFYSGNPLTGTDLPDLLLAQDAGTIDALGGDDLVLGDIGLFSSPTGNASFAAAFDLDAFNGIWSTDENPLVADDGTPHVTLHVLGEAGTQEYFRILIGAGQTIVIDTDAGGGSLGSAADTDTIVSLFAASDLSTPVGVNDDSLIGEGAAGSSSTLDSFLVYTNSGADALFYIRISEFGGDGNFEADDEFLVNISLAGHAVGAPDAQNGDTINGGSGNDHLFGAGGNDVIDGGLGIDLMNGGSGDDTYFVESSGDVVQETAFEGNDRVLAFASYTLTSGSFVERLETADPAGTTAITLIGNGVANTVVGNAGDNLLFGEGGDDDLFGAGGNDELNGGAGDDDLHGGTGDDTFFVDPSDRIHEAAGEGIDQLFAFSDYVLHPDAHVERLETIDRRDIPPIDLTGNGFGQTIIGNNGNNILRGEGGNDALAGREGEDSLFGGAGNDSLDGGPGVDVAHGGSGDDTYTIDEAGDQVFEDASAGFDTVFVSTSWVLTPGAAVEVLTTFDTVSPAAIEITGNDFGQTIAANAGGNVLRGLGGNDSLFGFGGNDLLVGGSGVDAMTGGTGDDVYVVDHSGDSVTEAAGEGLDRVEASASFTLGANVENLLLTGAAAINGTGNDLANSLTGNSAANRLDGGLGADTMVGGAGDDIYVVDEAGDTVTETASGDGKDLVRSSITYSLGAFVEKLTLTGTGAIDGTGNALNNVLIGNGSSNILDGGAGADSMSGGGGNDDYRVDHLGDRVSENAGEGTDIVRSSVSFALTANIENLVLTGAAAINATGNSIANGIGGNAAANLINGGGGADFMAGAGGNDIYIVDNVGDTVSEVAGEGTDLVKSTVTFTLAAHVERLTLRGSAAIDGTGNDLANTIAGNEAANRLDGGAGADRMLGAGGNDIYVVDDIADQAIEASSGGGIDRVDSSVTFALGDNIEGLTLTGAAAIDGTGNDIANTLTGNDAANRLDGGRGNDVLVGGGGGDTLVGGLGMDTLTGGAGPDDFLFDKALSATNVDTLIDFTRFSDTLVLENAQFKGLAAGAFNPNALRIGTAAGDADDRIVYDPATGNLYYDSDGTGATAQILFAVLDNRPAFLSAADFTVI